MNLGRIGVLLVVFLLGPVTGWVTTQIVRNEMRDMADYATPAGWAVYLVMLVGAGGLYNGMKSGPESN